MEEHQTTVDGTTYQLAKPFLVLATQNPIEYEGTFPLPEAQLDRFMLRIRLGYPSAADEVSILEAQQFDHPVNEVQQVLPVDDLLAAQEEVKKVYLDAQLKRYIVDVVSATRSHEDVYLGGSPRGSLALYRASQAKAALAGRDYIIPDDIKEMAEVTLAHRIIVGPAARIKDVTSEGIIADVLRRVPVPGTALGAARN
jgi:MoxR-like ATPase